MEGEDIPDELPPALSMEETFEWMAERRSQKISVPRSKAHSRKDVETAFHQAFELIGGVPRLAVWGHNNPGEFFKIYSKLFGNAMQTHIGDTNINVISPIPRGVLDGEYEKDG